MKAFKKELTMLGVMIALAIITAALNPSSFLTGDNLRNNIRHISLISLFAAGEAMVIIAGGIDLSVGATYSLAGVVSAHFALHTPSLSIAGRDYTLEQIKRVIR